MNESERSDEGTIDATHMVDVTLPESDGEIAPPTAKPKHKKTKLPKPPTEKKRAAKEDWGVPTLRAKDQNGKIIPVNSEKPVPIESESFKGFILIMVRTDGDQSEYNRYASHFEGKQRKFEVQFQVGVCPHDVINTTLMLRQTVW